MTAKALQAPEALISRRRILKSGLAGTAAAMILPRQAFAIPPLILRGQVIEDEAGGGVSRTMRRGIAGVLVSNGVDVVRTDGEGRYALPARGSDHVFIIKPAGYEVPLTGQSNLPRHFRDIGAHGEGYDFALVRSARQNRFQAILMADPQPESHRHLDYIRDGSLPVLAAQRAAFGLTLGDIVGDDLSLMSRYNAIMGQAGATWWNAGGNHDLDLNTASHRAARAPFRKAYGPATYAFEHGEAVFIVLDNVEYSGAPLLGGKGDYRGHIGAQQLQFVRNLLAHISPEKLLVLAMHIPLHTDWNPHSTRDNTDDAGQLLQVLAGRRAISFSGHMHATEHQYLPAGGQGSPEHHHQVLAALSGSWWSGPFDHRGRPMALGVDGCPAGFHTLDVDGREYRTTFVPVQQHQQPLRAIVSRCQPCLGKDGLVIDGPLSREDMPCEIVVNIFDGGPKSAVRARLPGGEWQPLKRDRRADPFMIDYFAQPDSGRHSWVRPEVCEHLWSAALPQLSAGLHRIEIEARDEFGRHLREIKVIERA